VARPAKGNRRAEGKEEPAEALNRSSSTWVPASEFSIFHFSSADGMPSALSGPSGSRATMGGEKEWFVQRAFNETNSCNQHY
jgi:hypothetical protein